MNVVKTHWVSFTGENKNKYNTCGSKEIGKINTTKFKNKVTEIKPFYINYNRNRLCLIRNKGFLKGIVVLVS